MYERYSLTKEVETEEELKELIKIKKELTRKFQKLIEEKEREMLKSVEKEKEQEKAEITKINLNELDILPNPYSSILELVVPKEYEEEVLDIIYKYKLLADAPDVIPQEPSILMLTSDNVAFEFYLKKLSSPNSSGYAIEQILNELISRKIPFAITLSSDIDAKVHKLIKKFLKKR